MSAIKRFTITYYLEKEINPLRFEPLTKYFSLPSNSEEEKSNAFVFKKLVELGIPLDDFRAEQIRISFERIKAKPN